MSDDENKPATIRQWFNWGLQNGHLEPDVYENIIQNTAERQDDKPCQSLSCSLQSAFFWNHSDTGDDDAEFDFWSNIHKQLIEKGL